MKKVLFIVAVATLFFSCQKEIEPGNPANSGKGFSFTAGIEKLATKADINSSNDLVWAEGDKIGVFGSSWTDKNQSFTLAGEGGSTTGKFNYDNGEFTATDASFAFFPWNGDNNGSVDGKMYFHLRDEINYTSGKMLTPLVATFAYDETAGDYPSIEFKHAGAAVKVTISNLPAGAHSICLAADQPVAGWFNVAMDAVGEGSIVPNSDEGAVTNSVWLNFEPADAEREFTFLFPVPALTAPKFSFLMYDENDVLVWSKKLKAQTVDLERGDVLELTPPAIEPYAKFTQISSYGIVGTHNSWGNEGEDYPMITDGTFHIAKGLMFEANEQFKVRKDGSWDESYGVGCLVENDYSTINGTNVEITTAGTYDIIFDSSKSEIRVVASKYPYPDAGAEVTLYVHPTTTVLNELCFKSSTLGTASWPGTPFQSYEIVAGQKFYTMSFPASKIWGKTINDLYVVDRDNWSAKDGGCTLTFPGGESKYYITATKNEDLVLLSESPTEPSITINGSFTDWSGIAGNVNVNSKENEVTMKSYSDGTNLFVYLKLVPHETPDLSSGRYFDLYFDTDNSEATGATEWYRKGADEIAASRFLVYFNHSGSVENADIQGIDCEYELKVANNDGTLEAELKVPLTVLGSITGDEIKIFSLGYVGGSYSEFIGSIGGVMIPAV